MELTEEKKKESGSVNKTVIIVALLLLIAVIAVAAIVLLGKQQDDSGKIGYASEAKVMLDQDSLQAAMDEAMQNAQDQSIGLLYKNNAFSEDGKRFECYIANSSANAYDMFLTICTDPEMTDQIFLSELVPPGSGFEEITLDRALDPGSHTVYVAVTQVTTDENGEQVIHAQVVHTMDFNVSEESQ